MKGELSLGNDIKLESADGEQVLGIDQKKRPARARRIRPKENKGETDQTRDLKSEPIVVTTSGRIVYSNLAGASLLGAGSGAELAGRSFADFVSKDWAHHVLRHMERREAGEPPDRIEYPIVRLDGADRFVEAYLSPADFAGRPAAHSLLRDITDDHRSSDLFDAVSEGFWRIEFTEPIPLNARPASQKRRISASGRIGECNQIMASMLGAQAPEEVVGAAPASFPLFNGFVEQIVRSRYKLLRWVIDTEDGTRRRTFILNAVGTIHRSKVVRIWGNCTEITAAVDVERRMVSALQNQLRHIGRELHDDLGQVLTASSLISECIKVDSTSEENTRLERVRRLVELIKSAREIVHGLHRRLAVPSIDGGNSLMKAVANLCDETDRLNDVRCTFGYDYGQSLPVSEKDVYLYRIIHEAVANAVKHAEAAHIHVSIARGDQDEVIIEITDDGVGFNEEALATDTPGLAGLYYWARRAGGHLEIKSASDGGTTVQCTLPTRLT